MWYIVVICIASFLASILTFFSGFGLGTILSAVLFLFFDVPVAIAITSIVHLLNNVFKLGLIGKNVKWPIVWSFGLPSIFGALAGAFLLKKFATFSPILTYDFGGKTFSIIPMKLLIAGIMIVFILIELGYLPLKINLKKFQMVIGGLVSGFFGGLSGHQGALRSAFLLRTQLSKEAFIASGVVIACLVDLTRLPLYFSNIHFSYLLEFKNVIILACISAFLGAYGAAKMLKNVTMEVVKSTVVILLLIIASLLALGII